MKTQEYYIQQKQSIDEDNYNNIKNLIILTLIIIFAYLCEKFFRNIFINTFYLTIILIIVAIFLIIILSNSNKDTIKNLFPNFYYIPNKTSDEIDKKKIEKLKNIYESGYMFNKMNINNYSGMNQMFNRQSHNKNFNYDNNFVVSRNEDDLANKISNINKINNKGPLINSFNKIYTNGNSNENYNNDNINANFDYNFNNNNNYQAQGPRNFTNLPSSSSTNNDFNKNKIFDNNKKKDMIYSPFNQKTRLPPSSGSSSENYYLFSNNKKNKEKPSLNSISDFNNINPVNRLSYIKSISDFDKNIYENQFKRIPKNKEISYNKYQYLKSRYHNTQALNQDNNMLKYNIDKIPRDLANINYKNWIIKMKNFISRNLIPNIVSKHDDNISNLNTILSSLGIKITSSLTENEGDDYLRILKEKIYFVNSNKININLDKNENKLGNILNKNQKNFYENNFRFMNKDIDNNMSIFPSLMNFSNYLNETNENDKYDIEKNLKNVFFGDTIKIKQILAIIENKISSLEMQKNSEYKSTSYYQRQKIIKTINLNNNPFLNTEYTKTIDNYIKNINDTNNFSLTNLQRLLYERIVINERLYPKELFSKKDEIHALLVIEYVIERFRQLQQDFNLYGNGSRGGDFLNENWCSLLPTDSQIIAHLIINYIETIYEINNNQNQQVFLLSYPSNYNILTNDKIKNPKIQTSIFLYQINPPNIEPKFNIVYDGNLIPCPTKDINLFHAFSIYFYLLSSNSAMFVMNLGIHGFINELLK